jgi:AcrR family transcriptional regulator
VTRRRTGRRPGKQDTRETILASARETFAELGYDGASIRQIAAAAAVDPALVHHYFGTKEQLFLAVVQPPIDPAVLLPRIFAGGVDGLAERIVATFLSVWEGPTSGPAFRSLLRGAVSHQLTGRLVREFFATQIVRRVIPEMAADIDPEEAPLRASLVASQLFGLAVTRYILEFEPLASTPAETVVAAVAPNIQRYLTGDLTLPAAGVPADPAATWAGTD